MERPMPNSTVLWFLQPRNQEQSDRVRGRHPYADISCLFCCFLAFTLSLWVCSSRWNTEEESMCSLTYSFNTYQIFPILLYCFSLRVLSFVNKFFVLSQALFERFSHRSAVPKHYNLFIMRYKLQMERFTLSNVLKCIN